MGGPFQIRQRYLEGHFNKFHADSEQKHHRMRQVVAYKKLKKLENH